MNAIINPNATQVNTPRQIPNNVVYTQDVVDSSPRLTQQEFQETHEHKRAWLRAACVEGKLRGNEGVVLEALAFLTNPATGVGSPAIGSIQEKLIERGFMIGYNTVRETLARIQNKRIIEQTQGRFVGGKKTTNTFKLVGYEYKSAFYSPESVDSLNTLNPDLKIHTHIEGGVDKSACVTFDEYVKEGGAGGVQKRNTARLDERKLEEGVESAQKEIERVAQVKGLTPREIVYILFALQTTKGIVNKGGYVNAMITGIKAKAWQLTFKKLKVASSGPMRYGVPVVDLERHARPGESAWDVAQRLRPRGVRYET